MGKFYAIENDIIRNALKETSRQYLVGNLKKPQILPFLNSELAEIGITSYDDFCSETPHFHTFATEYQFVLSGYTEYIDTDTEEIHCFRAGDFYAILPMTKYAQRSKPGTKILFIKTPSVNDKTFAECTEKVTAWLSSKIESVRKDYYHKKNAPAPNSVRPATAAAIVRNGKLLMLKRKDNKKWTVPGGTLELNESLNNCMIREINEETGLDVEIVDIIGTYTDPEIVIEYSDGEVRREFTILYYCKEKGGSVLLDEESEEFIWVPLDKLEDLNCAESQKIRLKDIKEYFLSGKKSLR